MYVGEDLLPLFVFLPSLIPPCTRAGIHWTSRGFDNDHKQLHIPAIFTNAIIEIHLIIYYSIASKGIPSHI